MGFCPGGVWVMGYCGLMGHGLQFPAHRGGGPKNVWDFGGYGLWQAWVMRVPTVHSFCLMGMCNGCDASLGLGVEASKLEVMSHLFLKWYSLSSLTSPLYEE